MSELKVGLFPHCCGAKILYGFPTGYDIPKLLIMGYKGDDAGISSYKRKNEELAQRLREDIQSFFDKGFKAYGMETIETYDYKVNQKDRRAEGSLPLDKNAWVFAITNDAQDHLCRSVLEGFNFKCINERINPNSSHTVYLYLLTPNW